MSHTYDGVCRAIVWRIVERTALLLRPLIIFRPCSERLSAVTADRSEHSLASTGVLCVHMTAGPCCRDVLQRHNFIIQQQFNNLGRSAYLEAFSQSHCRFSYPQSHSQSVPAAFDAAETRSHTHGSAAHIHHPPPPPPENISISPSKSSPLSIRSPHNSFHVDKVLVVVHCPLGGTRLLKLLMKYPRSTPRYSNSKDFFFSTKKKPSWSSWPSIRSIQIIIVITPYLMHLRLSQMRDNGLYFAVIIIVIKPPLTPLTATRRAFVFRYAYLTRLPCLKLIKKNSFDL